MNNANAFIIIIIIIEVRISVIGMKVWGDLDVHISWFINNTNLRKMNKVGYKYNNPEYLFPMDDYFDKSFDIIYGMVGKIDIHCVKKFPINI